MSLQSDKLRAITMVSAIRLHSFRAASDFEAFRKNYDYNGWGQWEPELGSTEHFFTDEDVAKQQVYLREREGC